MSEHAPQPNRPMKWLFPVIFLAIIAIAALYIVRNNFNDREPTSDYTNKNTRSDHRDTMGIVQPVDSSSPSSIKPDSLIHKRERASMPEADSTR